MVNSELGQRPPYSSCHVSAYYITSFLSIITGYLTLDNNNSQRGIKESQHRHTIYKCIIHIYYMLFLLNILFNTILCQCQDLRKALIRNGKMSTCTEKSFQKLTADAFFLYTFPYMKERYSKWFFILSRVASIAPKYTYRQSLNSDCLEKRLLNLMFLSFS